MSRSTWDWLRWPLAFSPALLPLAMIIHWGVDTHYWDEWDPGIAGLFIKLQYHQLAFADLVAQHNEHRMLLPRLLFLLLSTLTHWNNFAYLICIWLIVTAISAAILQILCRDTDLTPKTWVIWFLCNLMLFTPNQDQTWLWGFGLPNVLPGLLFLAAVVTALGAIPPWRRLLIMILLASAATFTNGNGLLCWPLLAIFLAFSKSWPQLLIWIAAAGLNLSLYFHHYVTPTFGGVTGDHGTPDQIIAYFLAFLGNPFSTAIPGFPETVCIMSGLAMLILFLIAALCFLRAWHARRQEFCVRTLPWFVVAGFGLLNAFLAARSRAGFGIRQALETRYVCSSLYLPVGLIALVPFICRDLRLRVSCCLLAVPLIALQALSFPGALGACRKWSDSQRAVKAAILLIHVLPGNPQLVKVFPAPSILVDEAEQLSAMQYLHPPLIADPNANLIRQSDPFATADLRGRLQAGVPDFANTIRLVGWAISQNSQRPADAVFITYENARGQSIICAMAEMGLKSPSVAEDFHNRDYLWSGWQIQLPVTLFPADLNPIRLRAWALDTGTARAVPLDGSYWLQR
ncbi:MAG: hypothetical protein ABSF29_05855 [Tepidisphaeraceae bacterium]|jgi:hypothetical protein